MVPALVWVAVELSWWWLARFVTPSEYCGFAADALEDAPTALWSILISIYADACTDREIE